MQYFRAWNPRFDTTSRMERLWIAAQSVHIRTHISTLLEPHKQNETKWENEYYPILHNTVIVCSLT